MNIRLTKKSDLDPVAKRVIKDFEQGNIIVKEKSDASVKDWKGRIGSRMQ